jgi:hypothetical protein
MISIEKVLRQTVCAGGMLEWPPGVETLTRVSNLPFSAMLAIAMTEPSMSLNMPTRDKGEYLNVYAVVLTALVYK